MGTANWNHELLCDITTCPCLRRSGHPEYRALFPNGYSVPNPCGTGYWDAVGHYDPTKHTITKNPFGLDFARNGHIWDTTLCGMDSDKDGLTNGKELGDPTCAWTVGGTPSRAATGQPGICEPIGSQECSHQTYGCGCHGNNCGGK